MSRRWWSVAEDEGGADAVSSDPEVAAWQKRLADRKPGSADRFVEHLAHFSKETGTPPGRLHRLAEQEVQRLVRDFVAAEKRAGRAAGQLKTSLEVVKLWLEDHGWQLAEWPEWV